MVQQTQVIKIAKQRARDSIPLLKVEETKFLSDPKLKKFVGKPVKSVCIPPSLKAKMISTLRRDAGKAKGDILLAADNDQLGLPTFQNQQSVIKRVNTFNVLTNKIPTCTPEQMEGIITDVTSKFDGETFGEQVESVISAVGEEDARIKAEKEHNTKTGRERNVKTAINIAEAQGKTFTDLSKGEKAEITEQVLSERAEHHKDIVEQRQETGAVRRNVPQWKNSYAIINDIHEQTGTQLLNFVKGKVVVNEKRFATFRGSASDSKPSENILASPCGLRVNMGFNRDGLQVAQDKLAFMGSAEDWHDYYINSKSLTDINRNGGHITFMKMHPEDWAGCVKDIYEGERDIPYDQFVNRVGKADFVIPEQFYDTNATTLSRKTIVGDETAIVGYKR